MSPPPAAAVAIRSPTADDAPAIAAAAAASRALHHPWVDPPTTPEAVRAWLEGTGERRLAFLLTEGSGPDAPPVGVVNASEIVRGAFQSCYLGYHAFSRAAGRGLMAVGFGLVLDHLFDAVGLHRAEANIQPGNVRSVALVRRSGFTEEGFSRDYLHIDGAWRDHQRWALLATDPRPWHVAAA